MLLIYSAGDGRRHADVTGTGFPKVDRVTFVAAVSGSWFQLWVLRRFLYSCSRGLCLGLIDPGCLMALTIKDPATERTVRELAAATGESVTSAIHKAAAERLQRVRPRRPGRHLADEILEIGARCAALPDLDGRSAEHILGYDQHGLPS